MTRATQEHDVLNAPDTGHKVVRGSTIRGAGLVISMGLTALASAFLLRHLGVVNFGRFVVVMSLISIVTGLADAGLTTIGQREYVLCETRAEKKKLLANILGIRLLVAPVGAVVAIGFALLAYPKVMVQGTALAGIGIIFFMAQVTLGMPLSAELRLAAVTATEVVRQFVIVLAIGLLVLASASLLPFFAVQIPAGAAALLATVLLVRNKVSLRPAFDWQEWRTLMIKSLPVGAALALNVVYFRLLQIMMSVVATGFQTGLFGTSLRIMELLVGVPVLLLGVALPVLSHAGHRDESRHRYVMQRMTEVAAIIACYLILMVVIMARPVIEILGGSQYSEAVPVLQIQAFALLGAFLGQVWQLGLVSIHRQSALIVSNAIALTLVLALGFLLIPPLGAQGAALSAVVGETGLAAVTLLMLVKAKRHLMPEFKFFYKVLLAAVLAALPVLISMLVSGLPALVVAVVSTTIFAVVIWITGALPPEAVGAYFQRGARSVTQPGA